MGKGKTGMDWKRGAGVKIIPGSGNAALPISGIFQEYFRYFPEGKSGADKAAAEGA